MLVVIEMHLTTLMLNRNDEDITCCSSACCDFCDEGMELGGMMDGVRDMFMNGGTANNTANKTKCCPIPATTFVPSIETLQHSPINLRFNEYTHLPVWESQTFRVLSHETEMMNNPLGE